MKYEELGYSLPDISAKEAATKAIKILEAVASVDKASLFYCVQASNILALAGLRVESPYNEFHPDFSREKQILLKQTLRGNGIEIMDNDSVHADDHSNIFSILNIQATNELSERYQVLRQIWKQPNSLADQTDFISWCEDIHSSLVRLMEENIIPKEWLLDSWSPHNIRFGMVLGYPGPAISASCWNQASLVNNNPSEQLIIQDFPYQGIYCGTHVDFDYSASLKGDSLMLRHQSLWSETLGLVYEVFSEERLLAMPAFKKEYLKYKKYDEGV